MIWLLIPLQAVLSRLSGNGFGQKWGVSWLPEVLFSIPFGVALGWAIWPYSIWAAVIIGVLAVGWTYAWMQSGTWPMLRWVSHTDPNINRKATLKPLADMIGEWLGIKLGDEAYSWLYAALKGFLIGLPVGGIPLAMLWPLGYEIGSHARGRVERYNIDPHTVSESVAGAGAGLSIVLFVLIYSKYFLA